jgi:asparagine synthase (glutamine-hydrolysing)
MAEALRKSGCTALWRSDGGPLASADLAVSGLVETDGWAARGHDGMNAAAVHEHRANGVHTIVVGELEELAELAARLALAAGTPPAALAAGALAKFGGETPAQLTGEWSLIQRRADGSVTAMLSAGRRDPLLWAHQGPR